MKTNRHKMKLAWTTAAMVMLLAGCQSAPSDRQGKLQPVTPEALQAFADKQCQKPQPGQSQEDCLYYAKMQYGIQRNFVDHQRYVGLECVLTISWKPNGRYAVLSTSGNEQLCMKAWGVVSSTENLPAPPKKFPSEIILDFKPGS